MQWIRTAVSNNIFQKAIVTDKAGSAAAIDAYDIPYYQWLSYGSYVILSSWHLTDSAVQFTPREYHLPSPRTRASPYLTVAIRNSGISCYDFMNYACHFGSVYEALWLPRGSCTITYYSNADARRCFDELLDKQFEAGLTNVSAPLNRRCQCLSSI